MARKSKEVEPVDAAAVDILLEKMAAMGVSQRSVARESNLSLNRVGIILRKEPPPATVGEIGSIANVVGMCASEVIGQAEQRTRDKKLQLVENSSDADRIFDPREYGLAAAEDTRDVDTDED